MKKKSGKLKSARSSSWTIDSIVKKKVLQLKNEICQYANCTHINMKKQRKLFGFPVWPTAQSNYEAMLTSGFVSFSISFSSISIWFHFILHFIFLHFEMHICRYIDIVWTIAQWSSKQAIAATDQHRLSMGKYIYIDSVVFALLCAKSNCCVIFGFVS